MDVGAGFAARARTLKPTATIRRVDRSGEIAALLVVELFAVGYLALLLNVVIQDPDEARV